jgi:hypothetical protein
MSGEGSGRRARLALLAAYVVATFLAFPHPVAGRVLDLGVVFAWLAPAFLVAGLHGLGAGAAARHAFVAGLAAHAAVLHWIYVVTVTYGHAPRIAGVLAPLGLAAYIAAFSALFGAGAGWLGARGAAGPLALAALWTALDHLRSFALTGFPWATLGYAQHENAALLPLARWTGVYGLSFASVLGGAALAGLAREPRARGPWLALAGVAALHAAGAAVGARSAADPGAPTARIGVLQGNIDQGVKWSPEWAVRTLEIYERLTRRAAEAGARVVVWPETAVPGSIERDPALRARVVALADTTGATLVVGGVGVEGGPEALRFYDSAFVVEPGRGITARYDKWPAASRPTTCRAASARARSRFRYATPRRCPRGCRSAMNCSSRTSCAASWARARACCSRSRTTPGTGGPGLPTSSWPSRRCVRPRTGSGRPGRPTPGCRPSSTRGVGCRNGRRSSKRGSWCGTFRSCRRRREAPSTPDTETCWHSYAGSESRRWRCGAGAHRGDAMSEATNLDPSELRARCAALEQRFDELRRRL